MGDFSRSTFDRVKHYVGVRLQQGVPLVDADWNELEDIRRYEVQAFLKWFVGDGVPANNDGFRIAAPAGGGLNTIRLTATATGPGRSSVTVDLAASTAATALGFTKANQQASRRSAPARLTGEATQPFALTPGMTLVVSAEGAAPQTVTFTAANIGAGTVTDVVTAINAALTRVVASAGTGDDFVIIGGDGTPEGAGRCLVDGRDAVHEGRLAYASQPLYANDALAAEWGVPVVASLAPPSSGSRVDLVYLDVWDREVTSAEDDSLVNPLIGVESSVRLRREWAVRVRTGSTLVPVPNDTDYLSGHSYLPLAQLTRQSGTAAILSGALTDLRARNLLVPPSTLLEDVLGTGTLAGESAVDAFRAGYRRGENRPAISLREAINALLAGRLPATDDLPVSPTSETDQLRRAVVLDARNGLSVFWTSPRNGPNQVFASRLDLATPGARFGTAIAVTSGTQHAEPTAVPLPNGDYLVAYQNGSASVDATDVVFKRATFAGLPAAAEPTLFGTGGEADALPFGVLTGEVVTFFARGAKSGSWRFRRYRHTDNTFIDDLPVVLPPAAGLGSASPLHAAAAGGIVWFAYPNSDEATMTLARLDPAAASGTAVSQIIPAPLTGVDPFVVGISATEAMVFYQDGGQIKVISAQGGSWQTDAVVTIPASAGESQAAVTRDAGGTLFLLSIRTVSGGGNEVFLRQREPSTKVWGAAQQVIANPANDQNPHPVLVPGQGIWVLWRSIRTGKFNLFAKRIVTAL